MNGTGKRLSPNMVQPGGSPGSDFDVAGGASSLGRAAMLHVPSELVNNEAFQRVLVENQDLREALHQSNRMLRERYNELLLFQANQKKERDFLMCKFSEAKELVKKLEVERDQLRCRLEVTDVPSKDPNQVCTAEKETAGVPCTDVEMEAQSTAEVNADGPSPETSLASYNTITPSMFASTRLRGTHVDSLTGGAQAADGETEFVQLLKERKEQLEENVRKLQESNQRLEREKLDLLTANEELQKTLAQDQLDGQRSSIKLEKAVPDQKGLEEDALQGAGDRAATEELENKIKDAEKRNEILRMKLESFRVEVMRKEMEMERNTDKTIQGLKKQIEEIMEDRVSVKAQVTSLLAELHESNRSLLQHKKELPQLEDRLRIEKEMSHQLESEKEALQLQHSVQIDQFRIQVQNLETALKMERQNSSEEMRKLAQLQAAYTHLFQEYDTHLKTCMEKEKRNKGVDHHLDDLNLQLTQAEEALVAKQELIDKLKDDAEHYKTQLETIPVLKAQADIYKVDFHAERQAREKLHEQREHLKEQFEALQTEYEKLKTVSDVAARSRIEEMRNRHLVAYPQNPGPYPPNPIVFHLPNQGNYHLHPGPAHRTNEEQPDFCCPKCGYKAPDMDTLQIHVMECIQ